MDRARRRVLLVALAVVAGGAWVLAASANWVTDLWWFQELGYEGVFWTRQLWPWAVRLAFWLFLSAFFYANLSFAHRSLQPLVFRFQHRYPAVANRGLSWVIRLGSLAIGFMGASAAAPLWEWVARFVYRVPFGRVDPLFGKDLGFFIFNLPFYRLLHSSLAAAFFLALLAVGVLYALAGVLAFDGMRLYMDPRPRRHLFFLGACLFLLKAVDYRLQQFELVNSPRGVIFGASYTDAHVVLPLLWVMMALCLLGAVLLLRSARGHGLGRPALAVGIVLAGSVLLLEVLPGAVQRLVVEPNEIQRERPFIERAIHLTRFGYDLDRIEEREFPLDNQLDRGALAGHQGTLANVRLWDWRPMLTSFRQLQEIRFYYRFFDVDVARYRVDGQLRQVMSAVREFDINQINNRTWINEHLQYTHGYGMVASPVNESTVEGLPLFWLRDIPPRTEKAELAVTTPQIYFGEMAQSYALVGTRVEEFDYPLGEDNAWTRYGGRGGIPLGNLFRRALFALRTGTTAFVLSKNFTPDTRILMRRQLMERVRAIAPFLRYDADPYAVVVDGRIFWIIDAYTTASGLPYSQPAPGWGNYVRNSVKVVVDAYHGDTTFYVADAADPLVQAYWKLHPQLFKPLEEMPAGLRAHLRYPEDLFLLQARMYSVYHMTNPVIFYNQEDVWHVAREIYRGQEQEMSPYYTVLQLPDGDEPEMVLILPFTPARRNNMIAWLAARNDGPHYGRLVVYRFPKDQLVFGPMQIEARIDQDPAISEVLTLWDQAGSQVLRGNMLVLPMDNSLLYVKPIFLRAETGELPELVRVIVAFGPRLVMRPTLEEALAALFGDGEGEPVEEGLPARPSRGALPERPAVEGREGRSRVALLAEEALRHWDAAQDALRAGDWGAYGEALERLEAVLYELAADGG